MMENSMKAKVHVTVEVEVVCPNKKDLECAVKHFYERPPHVDVTVCGWDEVRGREVGFVFSAKGKKTVRVMVKRKKAAR